MFILEKDKLVDFMITKHRQMFNENISPIKLQKGLYFLYAFWGGDVQRQKNHKAGLGGSEVDSDISEIDLTGFSENLFNANFEAWSYGPVDRDVYRKYKHMSEIEKNNICCDSLSCNKIVTDFVINLLERIYVSNDFGLVDLSHEDKTWKDAFKAHFNEMNSSDIINEYATREA